MRKPSPAIRGATTSLGFVPALVFLAAANFLYHHLTFAPLMCLRLDTTWVIANTLANTWMLGLVALVYVLWVFALARQWVTAATGGGFVIAGAGLIARIVAEMPHGMAQVPLARMRPPEPYASSLLFARGLGLVAFAFGLACVIAACLSERRLRRSGPAWTLPR